MKFLKLEPGNGFGFLSFAVEHIAVAGIATSSAIVQYKREKPCVGVRSYLLACLQLLCL